MGQVAGAQVDRAVRGDGDPQQLLDVFSYLSNSFRGCPLLSARALLPRAFYLPSGGVSGAFGSLPSCGADVDSGDVGWAGDGCMRGKAVCATLLTIAERIALFIDSVN